MKAISDEATNLELLKKCTPGGERVLLFDATKMSNDILGILMEKGFTVEEMDLVFSLTRYRVTGKLKQDSAERR